MIRNNSNLSISQYEMYLFYQLTKLIMKLNTKLISLMILTEQIGAKNEKF